MTALRLYNPLDSDPGITAYSPVQDFYRLWYVPAATQNQARKPTGVATMLKRAEAVAWWTRLMASQSRPLGPPLCEITADDLHLFKSRLETATYSRGKLSPMRRLAAMTQFRVLEELQRIIMAAGPRTGRRIRAEVLENPPYIYHEAPALWPKETWTMAEAQTLAAAVLQVPPKRTWALANSLYAKMARATIALWFYTGHRATTYRPLTWDCLTTPRPGETYLRILRSVKTGKADKLAVHPQLLESLESCRGIHRDLILPWPLDYRALARHHDAWQGFANLDPLRRFSPQAWRRLHAAEIQKTGFRMGRMLGAQSLGHASISTTEGNYSTAARDMALLSLPNLWSDPVKDD